MYIISTQQCSIIISGKQSVKVTSTNHQQSNLYDRTSKTSLYTVVTVFIAHFSRVIHPAEIDRLTAL